jgi:hypothetical protein
MLKEAITSTAFVDTSIDSLPLFSSSLDVQHDVYCIGMNFDDDTRV